MRYSHILAIGCMLLTLLPGMASAEIFKCVSADGKINFSDQPCSVEAGEKKEEVRQFSRMAAKEAEIRLGKECWALDHRYSQCRVNMLQGIYTQFAEHCRTSMGNFILETERAAYKENYRRSRYENNSEVNDQNMEYSNRYQQKALSVLRCDALQDEMWSFTKKNFQKKIPEKDFKDIELRLLGISSDQETVPTRRRRRY